MVCSDYKKNKYIYIYIIKVMLEMSLYKNGIAPIKT